MDDIISQFEGAYQSITTHIRDMGLSRRAENTLKRENLLYIGDIIQVTETDFLEFWNVGPKVLIEVRDILNRFGFRFGLELSEEEKSLFEAYKTRQSTTPDEKDAELIETYKKMIMDLENLYDSRPHGTRMPKDIHETANRFLDFAKAHPDLVISNTIALSRYSSPLKYFGSYDPEYAHTILSSAIYTAIMTDPVRMKEHFYDLSHRNDDTLRKCVEFLLQSDLAKETLTHAQLTLVFACYNASKSTGLNVAKFVDALNKAEPEPEEREELARSLKADMSPSLLQELGDDIEAFVAMKVNRLLVERPIRITTEKCIEEFRNVAGTLQPLLPNGISFVHQYECGTDKPADRLIIRAKLTP